MLRLVAILALWLAAVACVRADDGLALAEKALSATAIPGDQAFLLGQARWLRRLAPLELKPQERMLKNKDKYPVQLEYQLWSMRNLGVVLRHPVTRLAAPSADFDPARASVLQHQDGSSQQAYVDQAGEVGLSMVRAMSCDASIGIDVGAPSYGYASTHQIVSLLVAHERGCIPDRRLSGKLQPYVSRVYAELMETRAYPVSDLYVERMAALCMVGHCGDLPDDMFSRLAARQGSDGLWRLDDAFVPRVISYEHGTALAYFVLSARNESGGKGKPSAGRRKARLRGL